MWRLIYSKIKLTSQNKKELQRKLCGLILVVVLVQLIYTCVIMSLLICTSEILGAVEKLYYSMGFEQI